MFAVGNAIVGDPVGLDAANSEHGGNVQGIAALVFNRYVFAFEATVGAADHRRASGAMVLAHRERLTPKKTQPELVARADADATPRPVSIPARCPRPGVFARHNAVDTPALLPDGTASELSVSATLRARGTVADARELAAPIEHTLREIAGPDGDDDPVERRVAQRGQSRAGGGSDRESRLLHRACRRSCSRSALVGFMMRRNAIVAFMCVELMLNAANLSLVTFARHVRRRSTVRSPPSS